MPLPANHPDTDYITLYTGGEIDPLQPELHTVGDVTIEDIAMGLANTCRYGGQCDMFYSVAEHSVMVSHLMEIMADEDGGDPLMAGLYGLLHDAPECLLGDTPRPIKRRMWWWKSIEDKWMDIFVRQFDLLETPEILHLKHVADRMALIIEMEAIKRDNSKVYEYIDDRREGSYGSFTYIHGYTSGAARDEWSTRYEELCMAINDAEREVGTRAGGF